MAFLDAGAASSGVRFASTAGDDTMPPGSVGIIEDDFVLFFNGIFGQSFKDPATVIPASRF